MLKNIILRNFRNFNNIDIDFSSPVNVLTGSNGQGKTNLLESIFFLSILRSFRTSKVADLKKIGTSGFNICGIISAGNWDKTLEINYGDKRKLKLDKNIIRKSSEFIRQYKTVVFSPDDISLVKGSSGTRRKFFDIMISANHPDYLTSLNEFNIGIRSRNILLRNRDRNLDVIRAYEKIIAENGSFIVNHRDKAVELFQSQLVKIIKEIKGEKAEFKINYRFHQDIMENDRYLERLEKERLKDIERGYTGIGPHFDDFELIYNSKLLKNYGSMGQCRLVALGMKMAKLKVIGEKNGSNENLIALVDDVTGELDNETKFSFYQVVKNAEQVFFTFTEMPKEKLFSDAGQYSVNAGKIEKI